MRIGMTKVAFAKLKSVIGNGTRFPILRLYVWSTLAYGCKAWAVRKDLEK